MFIVKNNAAVGWYARGFDHPDAVKAAHHPAHRGHGVPRSPTARGSATRGHVSHSPGDRAGARPPRRRPAGPAGGARSSCATRSRPSSTATPTQEEMPAGTADAVEILVAFAGKVIDLLSAAPRRPRPRPRPGGTSPGVRPAAPAPRRRPRAPAPARAPSARARCGRSRRPPLPAADGALRPRRRPSRPLRLRRRRRPPPPAPPPARGPRPRGPEGPRRRQAVRAAGGERDQALQRGQGHRGPQDEGHLRAAQGRHRARPADVPRPRVRSRSATPATTSTTSSCGSSPGATPPPSGPCRRRRALAPEPRPSPPPRRARHRAGARRGASRAEPADTAEAALREAALREGAGATDALEAVVPPVPGDRGLRPRAPRRRARACWTPARPADALAQLTHADVAAHRCCADHALFALGRAQEALGRTRRRGAARTSPPAPSPAAPSLRRASEGRGALRPRAAARRRPIPALEQRGRVAARARRPARSSTSARRSWRAATAPPRPPPSTASTREYPHGREARAGPRRGSPPSRALRPARTPAERARAPPRARQRAPRRGAHERGARGAAGGAAREPARRPRPISPACASGAPCSRAAGATEGRALLRKVPADSPHAAEAAYHLAARPAPAAPAAPDAYEAVADRFPGTPWARGGAAVARQPLPEGRPRRRGAALVAAPRSPSTRTGATSRRAAWRVGWADYRARRYARGRADARDDGPPAAPRAARPPGFLYWSGRARLAHGPARPRARCSSRRPCSATSTPTTACGPASALARLGGAPAPPPALLGRRAAAGARAARSRTRRRAAPAAARRPARRGRAGAAPLPESPRVQATLAWIDWRAGPLPPGHHRDEARLPRVGRRGGRPPPPRGLAHPVPAPLRRTSCGARRRRRASTPRSSPRSSSRSRPSTPGARSRAGARGLMQVMPATGRDDRPRQGRALPTRRAPRPGDQPRLRHPLPAPDERALRRARSRRSWPPTTRGPTGWTPGPALRGEQPAEEFIETIPFTETRIYVMIVLANREQYRRLYGLERAPPAPAVGGSAPVSFRLGRLQARRSTPPSSSARRACASTAARRRQLRPVRVHHRLPQARRGLLPRRGRRHPGRLRGERRGEGAALPQGQGRGLGHRRVRHAPPRHHHPLAARGLEGRALGPHPRDPAPHRAVAPRGGRHEGARRAHALGRLRRDPGRRRHPLRLDHRAPSSPSSRRLRKLRERARSPSSRSPTTSPPSPSGKVGDAILLDLNYEEDSTAHVDMNVVKTGRGPLRRGAGHRRGRSPSPRRRCAELMAAADKGIRELVALQKKALGDFEPKAG